MVSDFGTTSERPNIFKNTPKNKTFIKALHLRVILYVFYNVCVFEEEKIKTVLRPDRVLL